MRAAVLVAAVALCTGGCGACEPSSVNKSDGAAASAATGPFTAPVPPAASAPAHPSTQRLACRAIAVDGDVHLETKMDAGLLPLLIEGLVPTEGWIALGKGAKFVAKDPRTSRETTFHGGRLAGEAQGGRVRACVGYAEESWVAAGGFESTLGSGESPGQEEWVVTPLAVVRYAAAKLSVEVRPKDESVTVGPGVAFLWAGDDARFRALPTKDGTADGGATPRVEDGWIRLENAGVSLSPTAGSPDTLDAAHAAVSKCSSLAKIAHDLTSTLMAGGADAAVVTQQVTTRRLARAACDLAGLRVGALPPSEASLGLGKSLTEANTAWTTLAP